jgi:SEC-C motif-containing protein
MSAMLQSTCCPCESHISLLGKPCCEEIISGARKARSAKELLRARYTAFATCAMPFILASTHPRVREESDEAANRTWAETSTFTRLEILDTCSDGDSAEYITFEAHFTQKHQRHIHRERARFELLDGEWFFVSSEILKPQTIRYDAPKPGRNEPCPCGSGRKYKKCCSRSLREIMTST